MSVNDAFVMGAWGEAQNAEQLLMLADGNENLPALSDLSWMPVASVWVRERRGLEMIVDDGVVTHLAIEALVNQS